MLRKAFPLDLKSLESTGDVRRFRGYASTFDTRDQHNDIVRPGAFSNTLAAHKAAHKMPALLLHHDRKRPVGVIESLTEDSRGLLMTARLTTGVTDADEAYALMKDGALRYMSIGYKIPPGGEEYDRLSGINYLTEIDLWEVSLVTIPANTEAMINDVKQVHTDPQDIAIPDDVVRAFRGLLR